VSPARTWWETVAEPPPADAAAALALAERVASITRDAYHGSDPFPGLPPPDGAADSAAAVERELAAGMRVLTARDRGGRDLAALRVVRRDRDTWEVRRVAVRPPWRGRGLARALIERVEAAAARAGVGEVRLDAVIERAMPQVYAQLGYRARSRWPSDDKPLTEVTMTRRPSLPRRPLDYPWEGDDALPPGGLLVSWWRTAGALEAVVALVERDPLEAVRSHGRRVTGPAALAGADLWGGAGPAERDAVAAGLDPAGRSKGGVVRFGDGPIPPAAYLMPRRLSPRLLALWRFPRGLAWQQRRGAATGKERAS
jgi:GNAT superfamily N-acetyltransferase